MSDSPTPTPTSTSIPSTHPPKPTLLYTFIRWLAGVLLRLIYRCERFGHQDVPASGAMLFACNHQSYLDPPMVSTMTSREIQFIARSGLFSFKPFAWLITNLNSIPLQDDGGDVTAIKEIIKRLDEDKAVLIFPEGSRSENGALGEFKRGVALLVKRAKCPVLPVALEGSFDAWPKGSAPRFFGKRVVIRYGTPIPYDDLMKDGPDAALLRLAREIETMRMGLREYLRKKSGGTYPAVGPGDSPRADLAPALAAAASAT